MPAPAATQAAIERALAAAKAQGLAIASFSVSRDGTVRITAANVVDSPEKAAQTRTPKKWAKG